MGNSASVGGLSYDMGASISNAGYEHWTINAGTKKDAVVASSYSVVEGLGDLQGKEGVTIFKFSKTQSNRSSCAQRHWQKIRTLKHPCILTYLDGADVEDALMLVTEQCTPLSVWLASTKQQQSVDKKSVLQELIWGFRCVLNGLSFLHDTCSLSHGYLGVHSIFVSKSGDWRLGSFDLACNINSNDDVAFIKANATILDKAFLAPERQQLCRSNPGDSVEATVKSAPYACDIYSIAQCIISVFGSLDIDIPMEISKHMTKMQSVEAKRRPTAVQLLRLSVFSSEQISLLVSLGELSIKPVMEAVTILKDVSARISDLTQSVCIHKILPSVAQALQMAANDFQNRDARETSRSSVQMSLSLLAIMGGQDKLDTSNFMLRCGHVYVTLWTMSDRIVRAALLSSLKSLSSYVPDAVFNKHIFDHILAGFADSNSKMREETLKSLVFVVDKLDEKNLQEKVVRAIATLQNDGEASIRTNVTIFLGKIAPRLKEAVRTRVLCNAYVKAMRDPFVHCRVAGLKAAQSSIQVIDVLQLSSKLMPQASVLLLDRSPEARELAITLLLKCVSLMKENHVKMVEVEKTAALCSSPTKGDSKAAAQGGSDWASWAVDGLAKTLEKVAVVDNNQSSSKTYAVNRSNRVSASEPYSVEREARSGIDVRGSKGGQLHTDSWDDNDNDLEGTSSSSSKAITLLAEQTDDNVAAWDDDLDLDVDFDDRKSSKSSTTASVINDNLKFAYKKTDDTHTASKSNLIVASNASGVSGIGGIGGVGYKSKATKSKVEVKKLAVDASESWDDF